MGLREKATNTLSGIRLLRRYGPRCVRRLVRNRASGRSFGEPGNTVMRAMCEEAVPEGNKLRMGVKPSASAPITMFSTAHPSPNIISRPKGSSAPKLRSASACRSMMLSLIVKIHGWLLCGLEAKIAAPTIPVRPSTFPVSQSRQGSNAGPALKLPPAPVCQSRAAPPTAAMATNPPVARNVVPKTVRRFTLFLRCPSVLSGRPTLNPQNSSKTQSAWAYM